jgi:hypothetical protein
LLARVVHLGLFRTLRTSDFSAGGVDGSLRVDSTINPGF